MNNIIENIVSSVIVANAEKEVEKLLKIFLRGTLFSNKTYSVGGYVRDQMLGIDAKDLDIVVEMKDGSKKITHFIKKSFGDAITKPHRMGAGYPIWQITFKDDVEFKGRLYKTKGAVIEFADTMKESFPDEGSRQRETEFGTLEDDVKRRDFSVNMLMRDLTTGELKDLAGVSKKDIEDGILRGHPNVDLNKIFRDDPLRMLRLVRFNCKYNWKIPMSVLKTVKNNAKRINIVSAERIMSELTKVMKLGKLEKAIRLMKTTGLLKYVLPEIDALRGVKQSPKHHAEGDCFKHVLNVIKNAPATVEGQMSALLHDVGKPATQEILEDNIHFYGHEDVGAEIAKAMLYRLKFDSKTIKRIEKMVESHMRPHTLHNASEKALRKFIRDVGDELVDSILDLAEADALGSIPIENYIPSLRKRIEDIRNSPIKVKKEPVLNGHEIMELLKIKAGPEIGEVNKFLIELQDDYAEKGKELSKKDAMKYVMKKFRG